MNISFLDLVIEVLEENINRGITLPFDLSKKDVIIYTKKYKKEFKNLTPQSQAEVVRFLDEYNKSSGKAPNRFEYKFKGTQRIDADLNEKFPPKVLVHFNIYGAQLRHSKPSLHVLVAEGQLPTGGKIIAFFRVLENYDIYTRALDQYR